MKKEIWDEILYRLRTMPQDEFNKFIKDTEQKFGELTEIINRPSNSNNGMELTSPLKLKASDALKNFCTSVCQFSGERFYNEPCNSCIVTFSNFKPLASGK